MTALDFCGLIFQVDAIVTATRHNTSKDKDVCSICHESPVRAADDDDQSPLFTESRFSQMELSLLARPRWRAGIFRSVPWLGICALVVTLFTIALLIAVLCSASEQAVDAWPSEQRPAHLAVVLAILVAVGNTALLVAHREAITISWWVKMIRGGDLGDCHRYWEHGSSTWQAIKAPRHISKVSVASVVMVFLFLVGPLLQRAATIETISTRIGAEFNVKIATDGFSQPTGYYMTHAPVVNTLTPNFSMVLQDFTRRSPINLDLGGCVGDCTSTVIAAGFDHSCETNQVAYNLDIMNIGSTTMVGEVNVTTYGAKSPEIITISTLHKPSAATKGNLTRNTCLLHFAQVKYPIRFSNGTLMLQSVDPSVNSTITWKYLQPESAGMGQWPSTLGGINMAITNVYQSSVQLYPTTIFAIQGMGPMQYSFMTSNDSALGSSAMTWTDLMPYVLDAIRELTFRTAVAFSNQSYHQTTAGLQYRSVNIYVLRSGFLGGAVAILLLATIAIGCLFNGYWLIGRQVSMSPLEIARVFQAPLTTGASSNVDVTVLLKEVGKRKAKYGALGQQRNESPMSSGQTLAIASPLCISHPINEHQYV